MSSVLQSAVVNRVVCSKSLCGAPNNDTFEISDTNTGECDLHF